MRKYVISLIDYISNIRLIYLAIIGTLFVLVWAVFVVVPPISDASYYNENAISISDGQGYDKNAYWPVGYSLFLGIVYSIFGPSLVVARIANALLYIATIGLTYYTTRLWFDSRKIATLASFIFIFYVGFAIYISLTMSELLFTCFLMLGIALVNHASYKSNLQFLTLLVTGASFGAATLVRPQAAVILYIVICFQGLFVFKQKISRLLAHISVASAGLGIVLYPWLVYTYTNFGSFVFVSNNGGINLFMGNNPNADGSYMENSVYPTLLEMGYSIPSTANAAQEDSLFRAAALAYIRQEPLEVLFRLPAKLFYFFRDDVSGWLFTEPHNLRTVGIIISQVQYMLVMSMALLGIAWYLRDFHQRGPVIGIAMLIYFAFIALVFFGSSRFRLPVMPIYFMFVGYYLIKLRDHWSPTKLNAQNSVD